MTSAHRGRVPARHHVVKGAVGVDNFGIIRYGGWTSWQKVRVEHVEAWLKTSMEYVYRYLSGQTEIGKGYGSRGSPFDIAVLGPNYPTQGLRRCR